MYIGVLLSCVWNKDGENVGKKDSLVVEDGRVTASRLVLRAG